MESTRGTKSKSPVRTVRVRDKMQSRYVYQCTEPVGKNFDPRFTPDLSPKDMLRLGVFGGVYLRDCRKEFPEDWFTEARLQTFDRSTPDKALNYFKVQASQPLSVWREKGWINDVDPRGWFQWYCRYYMGRRLPEEDERQIKRWRQMRRHIMQIKHHCRAGDVTCRPRQRQALLHWAYDTRKL